MKKSLTFILFFLLFGASITFSQVLPLDPIDPSLSFLPMDPTNLFKCKLNVSYKTLSVNANSPIKIGSSLQTIRVDLRFNPLRCQQVIIITQLPSWLTLIESTDSYIDFEISANMTSGIREGLILGSVNFSDGPSTLVSGVKTIINIPIAQYNCDGFYYYKDFDGDGFGYNVFQPIFSCTPISTYVLNHLDLCPNEYSLINNGCPPVPEDLNWIQSEAYDISENLVSSSKGYFDALGKSIQTQTLDIKENRIWATQTLYDAQGRPAFQSLSAPITAKNTALNFQYNSGFIKNASGSNFTSANFSTSDVLNPETIGNEENTLGWYYSASNADEPNQDITDRPYSRTIYSTLNPGAVKQTIGGNKIDTNNDGVGDSWKQGYSFSMPAAQEMYYVFGYNYFETDPDIKNTYEGFLSDNNKQITWLKATKSVVEDVHGNEAVVFTDTDGKTLGAARAGLTDAQEKNPSLPRTLYEVVSLIGPQKYIDIHIPKGCGGTASLLGTASNYTIYNLKTEQPNGNISEPGFYRIEYTGTTALTKRHTLTSIDKNGTAITPLELDAVGVRYMVNYYDFSLNYYNTVGNLTASLQPIGFSESCFDGFKEKGAVGHNENLKSHFSYNSLGQLLNTDSPDEGTANFKYRKDGQIRFSQNSKQALLNEFSYTNYDEFGRPTESGVSSGTFTTLNGETSSVTGNKEQHFTEYDFLSNPSELISLTSDNSYHNPSFLASNVAKTWNKDDDGRVMSTTYYSYDLYGRVKWIVQSLENFNGSNNSKTFTIDYQYDPITSQVLQVVFQKNVPAEKFTHKYTYNIVQELEKVETAASNNAFETHADYSYYETGALKRVEIAEGLQGIDYVYNLAGQLKGINHPNLDTESLRASNAQAGEDLFGMTLDYYNGDYKRSSNFSYPVAGADQYNGNIKGITWNTKTEDVVADPFQYSYQYNKNNWLTDANFNANGNLQTGAVADLVLQNTLTSTLNAVATNSITLKPGFSVKATAGVRFSAIIDADATGGGAFTETDYNVSGIDYDANGNIQHLNRKKNKENGSNRMDELTYKYRTDKPNQLDQIIDQVDADAIATNADDIKTQDAGNYTYNSIGQLTRNEKEKVNYEYNASGLVTLVRYYGIPKVRFYYNDKGFRTRKQSYKDNGDADKTTDYVRDAAGSVLAIYENQTQVELPIYGASRLGVYKKASNTSVYQLTDHLGNVRAVIAKEAGTTNAVALVSATDYYPFGMPMPNRRIIGGYRYQYQGQEVDPETGKEAFQLRLWDSRIGRWLTTDPAGQYASPYMGMGNNPISRIDPDGGFDWYANGDGELEWHSGSGVREGLMWAAADGTSSADLSRIGNWLGGSGNVSGAELVFSHIASIGNGWDDGLNQRGKDFVSFMDDPKGRTLNGVSNFVDGAGSFLSDFSESGQNDILGFAGKRAFENMSDMSLYDWSYAAGYSAPDIALGLTGGYVRAIGYGFNFRYYHNAIGVGANITKHGQRVFGLDYHRFRIGGKKLGRDVWRVHIDIPAKGVKHFPWHQIDKWKRGVN